MARASLAQLSAQVRACTLCQGLPLGPRPIFQIGETATILIVGQAPGRLTHAKGLPFDDVSGDRLRAWMGVDRATFYDPARIACLPMGFCYPGTGKGGDLPPRPECAATWRAPLLGHLHHVRLTLLLGAYALAWHAPGLAGPTLADKVRSAWQQGGAIALPHPSPRNIMWFHRNSWFEADVLPALRRRVAEALEPPSG